MARFKGTFEVPANYEPQKAAPFDARELVETKADLLLLETWQDSKGNIWIYPGLTVAVSADPIVTNNGIYRLSDPAHFNDILYWHKLAEHTDLQALQDQIDILSTSNTFDEVLKALGDLPIEGDAKTTYFVQEGFDIYKWNPETQKYDSYTNSYTKEETDQKILDAIASAPHYGLSEEIGVNENNELEIKTISTDKLIQGDDELILNGGTAENAVV